jgi:hypothetical protein
MDNLGWSDEIINILQRIRMNSISLNKKHISKYIYYNSLTRFFDIPIIVFSVFSASFTSLDVINSYYNTIITTSISMAITILSSIKLYLNLSNNINDEIALSKAYYILSINIYKQLTLRQGDPKLFLEESFSEYSKLIEQSSILYKNINKDLLTINEYFKNETKNKKELYTDFSNSSNSYSSNESDSPKSRNILISDNDYV